MCSPDEFGSGQADAFKSGWEAWLLVAQFEVLLYFVFTCLE